MSVPQAKSIRLLEIVRSIAADNPAFQDVLGPGAGDRSTNVFMQRVRQRAMAEFGIDYSEKRISGDNSLAVDFHFPDEMVIVEIALGLANPASEFEKDVLKAIMAMETGQPVRTLMFMSRPGGAAKCRQSGRSAVMAWAKAKHGLDIDVYDLHGEPRKREH